ncbi:MAG: hypothetical protein WDW38_005276 [Sanguina aurantia]
MQHLNAAVEALFEERSLPQDPLAFIASRIVVPTAGVIGRSSTTGFTATPPTQTDKRSPGFNSSSLAGRSVSSSDSKTPASPRRGSRT